MLLKLTFLDCISSSRQSLKQHAPTSAAPAFNTEPFSVWAPVINRYTHSLERVRRAGKEQVLNQMIHPLQSSKKGYDTERKRERQEKWPHLLSVLVTQPPQTVNWLTASSIITVSVCCMCQGLRQETQTKTGAAYWARRLPVNNQHVTGRFLFISHCDKFLSYLLFHRAHFPDPVLDAKTQLYCQLLLY